MNINEIKETLGKFKEISEINITEYVSILLRSTRTGKFWINKRTNPKKAYYGKWQCPGGKIELLDFTKREAAKRELLEETGIEAPIKDLEYLRMNHYFTIRNDKNQNEKDISSLEWNDQDWKIIAWRIVYCYRYSTYEIPIVMEPENMSTWVQRSKEQINDLITIDSLKDIFKEKQVETRIKLIEGACGCGKSTLIQHLTQMARSQSIPIEVINESFIIEDPEKRIIKYGEALKKYTERELTRNQMIEIAKGWERYIRDYWMAQIFRSMTQEKQPEILFMDRNLFSTYIFMKVMQRQGFYPKEEIRETTKGYYQWKFIIRESQTYWINPTIRIMERRLITRNREGESNIEYYRNLFQTYLEELPTLYSNIKVIGQQIEKPPESEEYIRECLEILRERNRERIVEYF